MGSSISSSDSSPEWGRCLAVCLGTLGTGLLLLFALMLLVDPYDSGRFGLLGIDGVDDRNTVTATASRARDVAFRFGHHRQFDGTDARAGRTVQSDRPAFRAALRDRRQSRMSSSRCSISSCATMSASARWCSLLTPGGAPIIQSNCRLARFRIGSMATARSPMRPGCSPGRRSSMPSSGSRSVWAGASAWIRTASSATRTSGCPGSSARPIRRETPYRPPLPRAAKSFPTSRCSMSWSRSFRLKLPSLWWCLRLYPRGGATRHGRGGGAGGLQLRP